MCTRSASASPPIDSWGCQRIDGALVMTEPILLGAIAHRIAPHRHRPAFGAGCDGHDAR